MQCSFCKILLSDLASICRKRGTKILINWTQARSQHFIRSCNFEAAFEAVYDYSVDLFEITVWNFIER